jgi:hypothetical protein
LTSRKKSRRKPKKRKLFKLFSIGDTMSYFSDKIKMLTGRIISQEEIEKAREKVNKEEYSLFENSRTTTEYKMTGKTPVIVKSKASKKTTQDLSHPTRLHTMFYNDCTRTRFYTPEGLLEEELVQEGSIYTNDIFFSARKFDPPGSFRGKKIYPGDLTGKNPTADDRGRRATIYG